MTPTTTEKVLAIRQRHPNRKATDIAHEVGKSRERVRQILKQHGLPTKIATPPNRCVRCGVEIRQGILRCTTCKREEQELRLVRTTCAYCGHGPLTMRKDHFRRYGGRHFCDRSHHLLFGWLPGNFMATRKPRVAVKVTTVSVSLPVEQKEALASRAKAAEVSLSRYVREKLAECVSPTSS